MKNIQKNTVMSMEDNRTYFKNFHNVDLVIALQRKLFLIRKII